MEGVQRVAGVAQAGGEGFALAGDGVRVDFSTGLRGGIGDSGNETADDRGGNDGQDGAGLELGWLRVFETSFSVFDFCIIRLGSIGIFDIKFR